MMTRRKAKPPDKVNHYYQEVARLKNLCEHTRTALKVYQERLKEAQEKYNQAAREKRQG